MSAVGYGVLSYEWSKDGNAISSSAAAEFIGTDTDTLIIPSFTKNLQGNYTCTVKDSQSSVMSNPANLTLSKMYRVKHVCPMLYG